MSQPHHETLVERPPTTTFTYGERWVLVIYYVIRAYDWLGHTEG